MGILWTALGIIFIFTCRDYPEIQADNIFRNGLLCTLIGLGYFILDELHEISNKIK